MLVATGERMMSMGNTDDDVSKRRAPGEDTLRNLLEGDWRRLFPWRRRYGQDIRRLLHTVDEDRYIDVRAAFGLVEPTFAATWLYRDFYVDVPPAEPGVDRAIGKLRRGNPVELETMLRRADHSEAVFYQIWYEVSTLTGGVIDPRIIVFSGRFSDTRGPSPDLAESGQGVDRHAIARAMRHALAEPIGVEPHRRSVLRTLGTFMSGELTSAMNDHSVALLIHHADFELRTPIRWSQLGATEREVIRGELIALGEALSSPPSFLRLLHHGLCSPSRKRRLLSYRLLRLDGHLDHCVHPDDFAATF